MKTTLFERAISVLADVAEIVLTAYAVWFLYHITPLLIEVV